MLSQDKPHTLRDTHPLSHRHTLPSKFTIPATCQPTHSFFKDISAWIAEISTVPEEKKLSIFLEMILGATKTSTCGSSFVALIESSLLPFYQKIHSHDIDARPKCGK
jgi:hypothetical protein